MNRPVHDVFISHSVKDREVARDVAGALTEAGLSVFYLDSEVPTGQKLSDAIWEALAESSALVVVASPDNGSAGAAMELGAAWAWKKPVFIVAAGPASARIPFLLREYPVFSVNRLHDLANAIKKSRKSLTDEEKDVLRALYVKTRIPTDELLRRAAVLDRLADAFAKQTGRTLASERLVQELIRMRKAGKLPRLKTKRPVRQRQS